MLALYYFRRTVEAIENQIELIVTQMACGESPTLTMVDRRKWSNIE